MKGLVFNLFEQIVRQEYGEAAWDGLLETASVEGIYTSLGSYPDEEFQRLVEASARATRRTPEEVVRWVGRKGLPRLVERYPHFFSPHRSTRMFLLTLNDIIHPEVRKIYPGADVPRFDIESLSETRLEMSYRSRRQLCAFGHGLIEGAAEHFGEDVTVEQPECVLLGASRCLFRIST